MTREALLVLGMHRSGTSATAGLLVRLGAQPPKTLFPADASNPKGHWESTPIWQFHEKLLREAGSRWDTYTRFAMPAHPGMSANLQQECRRVLRDEFGDAPRFVLKDPRMCRFVPFWLGILEDERVVPAVVLVVRNPLEVARSLGVRNGLQEELSLLMWLRHVLDAEFDTRGLRRALIRYEDVVSNWRSVADRIAHDLDRQWPSRPPADDADIDRFLSAALRHHHAEFAFDGVTSTLGEWVQRVAGAVERLQNGVRQPEALLDLDAVRQEFDRATSALHVGERIRESLEARAATLQVDVANANAQVRSLESQVDVLRSQVGSLQSDVAGLRSQSDRVAALERDRRALQEALTNAQQDAKALRESASWRITAPLRAAYRVFR